MSFAKVLTTLIMLAAFVSESTAAEEESKPAEEVSIEAKLQQATTEYEKILKDVKQAVEKTKEEALDVLVKEFEAAIEKCKAGGQTEKAKRLTLEKESLSSGRIALAQSSIPPEWHPVVKDGSLAAAFTLGPFPEQLDDKPVLQFLSKLGPLDRSNRWFNEELYGLKIERLLAKDFTFPGPARHGTAMYYVFFVKSDKRRDTIGLFPKVLTEHTNHFTIQTFYDFKAVQLGEEVALGARGNVIVFKIVNKKQAERFTFMIVGDGVSAYY